MSGRTPPCCDDPQCSACAGLGNVWAGARIAPTIKVGDELTLPNGRTARVTQACNQSAVYAGIVQDDNTVREDMRIDERAWVRHSIAQGRY